MCTMVQQQSKLYNTACKTYEYAPNCSILYAIFPKFFWGGDELRHLIIPTFNTESTGMLYLTIRICLSRNASWVGHRGSCLLYIFTSLFLHGYYRQRWNTSNCPNGTERRRLKPTWSVQCNPLLQSTRLLNCFPHEAYSSAKSKKHGRIIAACQCDTVSEKRVAFIRDQGALPSAYHWPGVVTGR